MLFFFYQWIIDMKLMKQEGHIGFKGSAMIRYKIMHLCFCFFNIFTFLRCFFGVLFQNSNSKAELNKRFISKGFFFFNVLYACFQTGHFSLWFGWHEKLWRSRWTGTICPPARLCLKPLYPVNTKLTEQISHLGDKRLRLHFNSFQNLLLPF